MSASTELVNKMSQIVRSVLLKTFDPARYPNPVLQWHYRILQAIALDEELPETPEDKTIPKHNNIHKRIGPLALGWGEELDKVAPAGRVGPPKKRKANAITGDGDGDAISIKREKRPVEQASSEKIESLYDQGNLMTVGP
jgi:ATP-dependent DNA helicase 2 subunit 1